MTKLFITSTGTEIGKTLVTASLIHQLRGKNRTVAAFKPILSGLDDAPFEETDTGIILDALGFAGRQDMQSQLTPWGFGPALSPDMAARREGRDIDFAELCAFTDRAFETETDVTLVEGVGGLMAPVGFEATVLDWLVAAKVPAVLVIGGYLGTISHTLTAARVLEGAGVPLKGLVMSARGELPVPPEETADSIRRFLPDVAVAHLPDLGDAPAPWTRAPDLLGPLGLA